MTNKNKTQKEIIKDLDERITVLEERPYYPPSMVDNLKPVIKYTSMLDDSEIRAMQGNKEISNLKYGNWDFSKSDESDLRCRCGDTDYSAKPLVVPTNKIDPERLYTFRGYELDPTMEVDTTFRGATPRYKTSRKVIGEDWGFPVYADDDDPEVSLKTNDDELQVGDKMELGSVSRMDALLTDCIEYKLDSYDEYTGGMYLTLKANRSYLVEYKNILEYQKFERLYVYNKDKEIYMECAGINSFRTSSDSRLFTATIGLKIQRKY